MVAERVYDAVVIGSGFGGSVVAYRLAREGRSVMVLERGQPYPPGAFARTPNQLRTGLWAPRIGRYGLLDLWAFDHLDVAVASGLGGGSLIYANVMLRKDERTFVRENLDDGGVEDWPVTRAQLERHYDAVEEMQRPQRFPLGAGPPYSDTRKTLAMLEAANAMKLPVELPPLAILFAPSGNEAPVPGTPIGTPADNLHGMPRSTCRLCGECDLGCNYGAKNTLDFTYLNEALRAGAEIRTCCEVRTIARRDSRDGPAGEHGPGGYRVGYRQHLEVRDGHPAHLLDPVSESAREVLAREVVLAAGAVGTTYLLLSNRATLPGLSPALGTRVSSNGDYIGWVRNCRAGGSPRYLNPSVGPVITAAIKVDERASSCGRGFLLQDAGAPSFADWLWHTSEVPGDVWRARWALLRRLIGRLRGRRDTDASELVALMLGDAHASAAMMPVLGMGRDIPNGRYRLRGSRLELDWRIDPSAGYFDAMRARFEQLAGALGGEFTRDPLDRRHRAIAAHPVGGCPMGTDARHAVVDRHGRVYGQPGLWIADGSVLPGPVGVNPSFTIAALADRFADEMLGGRDPRTAA
jgi:cholesterol oxidase